MQPIVVFKNKLLDGAYFLFFFFFGLRNEETKRERVYVCVCMVRKYFV